MQDMIQGLLARCEALEAEKQSLTLRLQQSTQASQASEIRTTSSEACQTDCWRSVEEEDDSFAALAASTQRLQMCREELHVIHGKFVRDEIAIDKLIERLSSVCPQTEGNEVTNICGKLANTLFHLTNVELRQLVDNMIVRLQVSQDPGAEGHLALLSLLELICVTPSCVSRMPFENLSAILAELRRSAFYSSDTRRAPDGDQQLHLADAAAASLLTSATPEVARRLVQNQGFDDTELLEWPRVACCLCQLKEGRNE